MTSRLLAYLLTCTVAFSSLGCSTMKTINPTTAPGAPSFESVKAGDKVVVHTRDGRSVRVVVRQIDGDTLVTKEGARYARTDVSYLQRKSFSVLNTTLLVTGLIVGALLLAIGAAYGSLADNIG